MALQALVAAEHTLRVEVPPEADAAPELISHHSAIAALSGVSQSEAFAIDEVNLFDRLGHGTFVLLSTAFYDRVYADDDTPWFRDMFSGSAKADAIRNQYEFFIQRMGGPQLYAQRKGPPALLERHRPFAMTMPATQRWLEHMVAALEEVSAIDDDSRRRMLAFFRYTAYSFLFNS